VRVQDSLSGDATNGRSGRVADDELEVLNVVNLGREVEAEGLVRVEDLVGGGGAEGPVISG
jgi:hypothetical protein